MYYYLIPICLGYVCYHFNIIRNCKSVCLNKKKRDFIRKIGISKILYITCSLLLNAIYIFLSQKLNKSLIHINNNIYDIQYVVKGQLYKIRFKVPISPSLILLITDEDNNDVTNDILPYIGPDNNFHGIKYTPKSFNKKKLIFETINGDELTFSEDDTIIIL